MIQKVIKVGSSLAVTIPKSLAQKLKIQAGDPIESQEHDGEITFTPRASKPEVDEELIRWADKFTDKYKDALRELRDL